MLLSPCSLILACYSFLFIHNAISCNSAETLFVTFFFLLPNKTNQSVLLEGSFDSGWICEQTSWPSAEDIWPTRMFKEGCGYVD